MKKIILISILFLSFNLYSKNLSFFYVELGMSKDKLTKLLQDPNYENVKKLPNNWIQFLYVPKSIAYNCKLENGVITEFIVLFASVNKSKEQYKSESKALYEDEGKPIRLGFQSALYKIKNQYLQLIVMDNPDDPSGSFEQLIHTSSITSNKIIKGENDMCLDNISDKYSRCEE